jgi:hypothetical protein
MVDLFVSFYTCGLKGLADTPDSDSLCGADVYGKAFVFAAWFCTINVGA